jgi:DNA-binding CsgD family transcriptional regulator/tetratricopeptide (TPR) repeat protein
MELLERDSPLKDLEESLHEATAGRGRVALVSGEAGIGKTALVEEFLAGHRAQVRVLRGQCDALFTPQPLAPLHDIAWQAGGELLELIRSADGRLAVFSALLRELQAGQKATVLVFEDIHWADAATLDLITYLGRRIRPLPTLILLTYRDDELDESHALRSVLGNLAAEVARRVPLEPLSKTAVAHLAGRTGRSAEGIHAQTGGNPFYVTELLAVPPGSIPATVRDATLARAARLSPEARDLLELCSVVPNRVERWLLEESFSSASSSIAECVASGLLTDQGELVTFRHELARRAVESALQPSHVRLLHRTVLARLRQADSSLQAAGRAAYIIDSLAAPAHGREPGPVATARLVHHAAGAGDDEAVRRYAPEAARQASALGAHHEAARHYRTALDHTAEDDVEARATLSEGRAYECSLVDQIEEAIALREAALALRRQQDNQLKVGDNLHWLARLAWCRGRNEEARKISRQAVILLEGVPPGPELAMAYSATSQLHMIAEDCLAAVHWGERALQLAERLGLIDVVAHSLTSIGGAECLMGDPGGRLKLERGLALAREHGMHEHVMRAYIYLVQQSLGDRDYAGAMVRLEEGLAYAATHDLPPYLLVLRARANLERGHWQAALDDSLPVLQVGLAIARVLAAIVAACARLRRGDGDAAPLLDEARDLAMVTGDIVRVGMIAAGRAEAAWLRGNKAQMREELREAYEFALGHRDPWRLGELALWLWRAGALDRPPDGMAAPYQLEISGDWKGAAEAWERIGCPYERALALAGGDQAAQLQALDILAGLGAAPAAALVRRRLRAAGVRGVPIGPRATTKDNPLGLTTRQVEILSLLAENLSNKAIAARLRISPKTVDHHVVALMAKLGVSSRKQAASHPIIEAMRER